MSAPVLTAETVTMVPFSSQHFSERYVEWLNDKSLMRFSEQRHITHSIESCRRYIAEFEASCNLLWAVEDSVSGQHIGNASVRINKTNGLADISLLIGERPCAGKKGYGFVSWKTVMTYLSSREDIRKITGGCLAGNAAMIAIMKKSGMMPDGVRRAHYIVQDQPMDVVYFAYYLYRTHT